MDLEPFLKSVDDRVFEKAGIPREIVSEMQMGADLVEKIANEIIKQKGKGKATTLWDGLGAHMYHLIQDLRCCRNKYDDKVVELRSRGKDSKFALVWSNFYQYLVDQVLGMEPGIRDEVQEFEHFVTAERALARR